MFIMMQTIVLRIPKKAKLLVEENQAVSEGTVLAEGEEEGEKEILSLAKIFQAKPADVFKFLTKQLGDLVQEGDVLAKKEGFFGRTILKSPINGRIAEISQAFGEITLVSEEKKAVIKTPVSGRVKEINHQEIKIEFLGRSFQGKRGEGGKAVGIINYLSSKTSVLGFFDEIAGRILVSPKFSAEVLAKAWALRAAGVVGSEFAKEPALPFLIISKREVKELKNYQGKKAILEPKAKRLIVLEE